jgi:hypothetical protein
MWMSMQGFRQVNWSNCKYTNPIRLILMPAAGLWMHRHKWQQVMMQRLQTGDYL